MNRLFIRLQMRMTAHRIDALQKDYFRIEREYKAGLNHTTEQMARALERASKLRAELYALEHPAIIGQ